MSQHGRVRHLVVMGVSGSGKSTVATMLASRRGSVFAEGDEFHPGANIAKMTSGRPLDDADRAPWLASIAAWLADHDRTGTPTVVTCSALKRRYRDVLRGDLGTVAFVHLDGPPALIASRMSGRSGHFMPPALLDSQFADLEPLGDDEVGVTVDLHLPPERIVDEVLTAFAGPVSS